MSRTTHGWAPYVDPPGVLVVHSAPWDTTSTALRMRDGWVVVDSPVEPGEPEGLLRTLAKEGAPVRALLVTHADWDHLLMPPALPGAEVVLERRTAARLTAHGPAIAAELAAYDRAAGRAPRTLADLSAARVVDAPATIAVAGGRVEVHPVPGHTADGAAYLFPDAAVLCPGPPAAPSPPTWTHWTCWSRCSAASTGWCPATAR